MNLLTDVVKQNTDSKYKVVRIYDEYNSPLKTSVY